MTQAYTSLDYFWVFGLMLFSVYMPHGPNQLIPPDPMIVVTGAPLDQVDILSSLPSIRSHMLGPTIPLPTMPLPRAVSESQMASAHLNDPLSGNPTRLYNDLGRPFYHQDYAHMPHPQGALPNTHNPFGSHLSLPPPTLHRSFDNIHERLQPVHPEAPPITLHPGDPLARQHMPYHEDPGPIVYQHRDPMPLHATQPRPDPYAQGPGHSYEAPETIGYQQPPNGPPPHGLHGSFPNGPRGPPPNGPPLHGQPPPVPQGPPHPEPHPPPAPMLRQPTLDGQGPPSMPPRQASLERQPTIEGPPPPQMQRQPTLERQPTMEGPGPPIERPASIPLATNLPAISPTPHPPPSHPEMGHGELEPIAEGVPGAEQGAPVEAPAPPPPPEPIPIAQEPPPPSVEPAPLPDPTGIAVVEAPTEAAPSGAEVEAGAPAVEAGADGQPVKAKKKREPKTPKPEPPPGYGGREGGGEGGAPEASKG